MKTLKYILFLAILPGFLTSCGTEPEPIKYGEDACHFCEMTIVSQAHSAQAVSEKGKQFKYDAIECLVHDVIDTETKMAVQQVANYNDPGSMLAVGQANFVIHDTINSPMGENLAAIDKESPLIMEQGQLYTWEELKARFVNQKSMTLKH